ncbi:MAG: hypothetical protein J3K34DRAFT_429297 [Monoraphidium minutum]|nr:MAG: hypothetical protein J3K34DRAFT_429297 [Monoraphidium minutum]
MSCRKGHVHVRQGCLACALSFLGTQALPRAVRLRPGCQHVRSTPGRAPGLQAAVEGGPHAQAPGGHTLGLRQDGQLRRDGEGAARHGGGHAERGDGHAEGRGDDLGPVAAHGAALRPRQRRGLPRDGLVHLVGARPHGSQRVAQRRRRDVAHLPRRADDGADGDVVDGAAHGAAGGEELAEQAGAAGRRVRARAQHAEHHDCDREPHFAVVRTVRAGSQLAWVPVREG